MALRCASLYMFQNYKCVQMFCYTLWPNIMYWLKTKLPPECISDLQSCCARRDCRQIFDSHGSQNWTWEIPRVTSNPGKTGFWFRKRMEPSTINQSLSKSKKLVSWFFLKKQNKRWWSTAIASHRQSSTAIDGHHRPPAEHFRSSTFKSEWNP